jgi:hypothetical protein
MINTARLNWHCYRKSILDEITKILASITWEKKEDPNTFFVWSNFQILGNSKGIRTPGVIPMAEIRGENWQELINVIQTNPAFKPGSYFIRRKNTMGLNSREENNLSWCVDFGTINKE